MSECHCIGHLCANSFSVLSSRFSLKHICSAQTMQSVIILLRRGIACKAQCSDWKECMCFSPWRKTKISLCKEFDDKGNKVDFTLKFINKFYEIPVPLPFLTVKRDLKLSDVERVRLLFLCRIPCPFSLSMCLV
jgi:hypothetical protein